MDNKRYYTLNSFYQQKFGKKVAKISLNLGLSCPNKKTGGCIFCSHSSGVFAGDPREDVITQFEEVKKVMNQKWSDTFYIGYFQAGTNTYAPVSFLKKHFEAVLKQENVVGLSIATRSDAICEEMYDYLEELNQKTFLTVELGLQSIHEKTLKLINRGHSLENFVECVKKLQKRHIRVVVHIINGLPFESKEDMIETVKFLNALQVDGLKIHMLHVLKDTPLAQMDFPLLSKEEYIDVVVTQLTYLHPKIVIERITGDPKKEDLIAPQWLLKKFCVLNDIDKEMKKRGVYQGSALN